MAALGIKDQDIQALVDNELDRDTEKLILLGVQNHLSSRVRFEELLKQKELLRLWWEKNQKSS